MPREEILIKDGLAISQCGSFRKQGKSPLQSRQPPQTNGQSVRDFRCQISNDTKKSHPTTTATSGSDSTSASIPMSRRSSNRPNRGKQYQSSTTTAETSQPPFVDSLVQSEICDPSIQDQPIRVSEKYPAATLSARKASRTRPSSYLSSDLDGWTIIPRDQGESPLTDVTVSNSHHSKKHVHFNHDAHNRDIAIEIDNLLAEFPCGGSNPSIKQLHSCKPIDIPMTRAGFSSAQDVNFDYVNDAMDWYSSSSIASPTSYPYSYPSFDLDMPCIGAQFQLDGRFASTIGDDYVVVEARA